MTITLSPEQERAVQEAAARRNITPQQWIDERLREPLPPPEDDAKQISRLRREAIAAAQAQFAHVPGSVEEFMARKAEEKSREERRWNALPDSKDTP